VKIDGERREGLLKELQRSYVEDDAKIDCPLLYILHVGCAGLAIDLTQEEMDRIAGEPL
jgi:hypothetical protein